MKPFTATLLATALAAAFSTGAMAQNNDGKPDTATYNTMTQKAAADYKVAAAKCTGMTGNERVLCVEEAKVARARGDLDAVGQYNNTAKARLAARTALAKAENALARAKCTMMTGTEKDSCMASAKSAHTAALADVKADRDIRVAGVAGVDSTGLIANTATTDPKKARAVDRCATIGGSPDTGCLISSKDRKEVMQDTRQAGAVVANKTENLAERAVRNTKEAAATIANKTENAVERIAERTDRATDRVAERTDNAAERADRATDRIAERTERAVDPINSKAELAAERAENRAERASERAENRTDVTDRIGNKTEAVANRAGKAISDAVITTKIKADLFKEPELSAMAIDVDTDKGVVMLSGFVASKADADKAVRLAKSVEGVTQVKSNIKVK
ncbi:BON domain-containing protein [Massilia sp. PAMC28688]|uniref:BON domain-containing protein n=1 Tax=Massilia sp. PAMC28688 TaxID=2861283 RepID=UPI001C63831B|nr:BON domain-containing protein [Massilia sp. PAMC28688]QYF91897.1 BON domain-containing protein [Massilia sp. PAMC28688]